MLRVVDLGGSCRITGITVKHRKTGIIGDFRDIRLAGVEVRDGSERTGKVA